MVAEDLELPADITGEFRDRGLGRSVRCRTVEFLLAKMRFKSGRRHDLQDTRLTETICHEIMA